MKYVVFQGGLGNQIFQYAYYKYMQKKIPTLSFLFASGNSHNGFELSKWFETQMHSPSLIVKLMFKIVYLLKLKGICDFIVPEEEYPQKDGLFVSGYWQDKKYYQKGFIKFKKLALSSKNELLVRDMNNCQSVAIHVRRGDYIRPPYDKIYGGICTIDYYKQAIDIICQYLESPKFYVFSDDIAWVKNNLKLKNAVFVDWNIGKDSIYDMYLMSQAKANVIANSTFSYWGAYLNEKTRIVVFPKKWFASKFIAPNIFPDDWFGI